MPTRYGMAFSSLATSSSSQNLTLVHEEEFVKSAASEPTIDE